MGSPHAICQVKQLMPRGVASVPALFFCFVVSIRF
jgi:hypothetical protein